MVPIVDGSVAPEPPTRADLSSGPRADPVRFMVRALLVVYLSPVILVVCLIGAISILFMEAVKLPGRLLLGQGPRNKAGGHLSTKASTMTTKPHLALRKNRSHSAR